MNAVYALLILCIIVLCVHVYIYSHVRNTRGYALHTSSLRLIVVVNVCALLACVCACACAHDLWTRYAVLTAVLAACACNIYAMYTLSSSTLDNAVHPSVAHTLCMLDICVLVGILGLYIYNCAQIIQMQSHTHITKK